MPEDEDEEVQSEQRGSQSPLHTEQPDKPRICRNCHDTEARRRRKDLCYACSQYLRLNEINRPAEVYEPFLARRRQRGTQSATRDYLECENCHDTDPREWNSKVLCQNCHLYRRKFGIDRPATVYEPYLVAKGRLAGLRSANYGTQACKNCHDTAPRRWTTKDLCDACHQYRNHYGMDRPARVYESYLLARGRQSDSENT